MQTLAIHGVLGFSNESWLSKGSIKESLATSMRALESPSRSGHGEQADNAHVERLQSVAAQLLLLGHAEDAEEWFARCIKASASNGRQIQQPRSCLIAGLQGLHRNQLRSAWTGLQHALEAKQAPVSVVVQSYAALAAMYFNLGMRRPAMAAVERAMDKIVTVPSCELPLAVLTLMKAEFTVLDVLRQHERLHDLAFWPKQEEVAGSRVSPADARALLANCRRSVQGHTFLEDRVEFLDALLRIAYGQSTESDVSMAYVQRLHAEGLMMHAHSARHELALACIAGQRHHTLQQLMHVYAASSRRDGYLRNNIEHDYCLAKLGEINGHDKQYITHYREYACKSLVNLRQTCAYITVPTMVRQAATEIPKDDVA
jgi:tetratricopeptide (TPR) repeat protein